MSFGPESAAHIEQQRTSLDPSVDVVTPWANLAEVTFSPIASAFRAAELARDIGRDEELEEQQRMQELSRRLNQPLDPQPGLQQQIEREITGESTVLDPFEVHAREEVDRLVSRTNRDPNRLAVAGAVQEGAAALERGGLHGQEISVHQELIQEGVRNLHEGPKASQREYQQELGLDAGGIFTAQEEREQLRPGDIVRIRPGQELNVAEPIKVSQGLSFEGTLFSTDRTFARVSEDGRLVIEEDSLLAIRGSLSNGRGSSLPFNGEVFEVARPGQYSLASSEELRFSALPADRERTNLHLAA